MKTRVDETIIVTDLDGKEYEFDSPQLAADHFGKKVSTILCLMHGDSQQRPQSLKVRWKYEDPHYCPHKILVVKDDGTAKVCNTLTDAAIYTMLTNRVVMEALKQGTMVCGYTFDYAIEPTKNKKKNKQ